MRPTRTHACRGLLLALPALALLGACSHGEPPVRADLAQGPLTPQAQDVSDLAAFTPTVHFPFDSTLLDDIAQAQLDTFAWLVVRGQGHRLGPQSLAQLRITGHADTSGRVPYNDTLGLARAETVRRYLIDHGVRPELIAVRSAGELLPAVSTGDGVPFWPNRRVEILVER